MKLLKSAGLGLIFAWAVVSFVSADEPKSLAKQIALLPWKTDQRVVQISPGKDSRISIMAHYQKAGIVEDEDRADFGFIHPHVEREKNGDIVETYDEEQTGTVFRGGGDISCNGNGDFETLTADGFNYVFDLTWQRDGEKEHSFKKFHCRWVAQQKFEQDGFKVTVKVTLK